MSLTAEEVFKNPDLLSRNRGKPSIAFNYLDGTLGAILFEGRAFITTPNADNIYEPILGLTTVVQLRQDGRFGAEDPFLLPQQYTREHPHLACIRRPLTHRDDTEDVMFIDPDQRQHFRASYQSRIGSMDHHLVSRIREPAIQLVKRYYAFIESRPDLSLNRRFHGHATQLKIWIGRLESTKATWPDILFSFTQAQRHYLELEAYLEYMQVRKPLMDAPEYGAIRKPVANFVGAVTNKVVVVEELAKAGVPVWLIRPIGEFNADTRIDSVINPTPAEAMNIELRPWRGHKTIVWNTDAADPQRHNNLMLFGREFLAYTDFGRTSSVRDTIERPPPIPSFGQDYSAGPSRPPQLPPKPSPHPSQAAKQAPKPKPRIMINPTDALHFRPNPHRFMPIMMPAWSHGLQTVVVRRTAVSPQYQEGANGFIFPPPAAIVPLHSEDQLRPRQLKMLHKLINHLDVLLLRMSPRLSPAPISRVKWDFLLGPETSQPQPPRDEATPSQPAESGEPASKKIKLDKNAIRRQEMQDLLAKWTEEIDRDHKDREADLTWHSEELPANRWPHDRVVERIMYEIIEINFRWELRMLDKKMIAPDVDPIAHDDLVNQCFPSTSFAGEGGGDHMNVTYLTAWSGLSNPDENERGKYIIALARVIAQWKDCPSHIADCLQKPEADVNLSLLERACSSFFCKRFFYHFARAPTVPHRTTIDPSQYIMP